MIRVLVAGALEPFLADTPVNPDIDVTVVSESDDFPGGDFAGVLPHVARRVGRAELDRLPSLRVIANYGVGYDNIDIGVAASRGVRVSNTPGVLTDATAELTWALILAATRRLGEGERLVRARAWTGWTPTQLLGSGLRGKLLGIVGAGRIGMEVGRRASAFGMRLAYWSRTAKAEWERETGARRAELSELLVESDVLSLHVALTSETRRLIDAAALARMKESAILVNTSRGGVLDEAALGEALAAGRPRAAALDVYEREPHVPEALRRLENVVVLPHLGSATEETRRAMWELAWENLLRGVRGEPLVTPVA
jgi:glyoxylate reductase